MSNSINNLRGLRFGRSASKMRLKFIIASWLLFVGLVSLVVVTIFTLSGAVGRIFLEPTLGMEPVIRFHIEEAGEIKRLERVRLPADDPAMTEVVLPQDVAPPTENVLPEEATPAPEGESPINDTDPAPGGNPVL